MAETAVPGEAVSALEAIEGLLGGAAAGVWLYGSAAAGGLRKDSDVDILAAVTRPLTETERKALAGRLMAVSGRVGHTDSGRPIEVTVVNRGDIVPWRYPPRKEFVYGEWLRDKYERGAIPAPADDPDLAILISQARQNSIPLYGPGAKEILPHVPAKDTRRAMRDCLPGLLRDLRGDERNVLLTFARMWVTAATGGFLPKDAAALWAAGRLSGEQAHLLEMAGQAYLGTCADRWEGLEPETEALARHMIQEITSCLDA